MAPFGIRIMLQFYSIIPRKNEISNENEGVRESFKSLGEKDTKCGSRFEKTPIQLNSSAK
ncbi:hypothetical protein C1S99_06985 [Vibrio parahaemolyticus]|nr:hypothetical protein HC02_25975 [Vibrio parahaemolyticus]PMS44038.1 hypothetical protein C1T12_01295 [Vibrio parahaemolyticus]PMS64427.1 hypothetical protein C1S91_01295 [Vibrio parahaemolyticus]PMS69956.1 hypothetical protein C1S96_00985 [Vibrio parahaemolyticus]PMS75716.1 hypothetical protein C1T10_01295 [Vibrio parahaemolyticus]